MKKILFIVTIALAGLFSFFQENVMLFAQVPQGISYQAVARDASGNLIASQTVRVRFSIRTGAISGPIQYQETQNPTTTAYGVFSVTVGQGTPVIGTLASVTWNDGQSKFLQTELDPTGGTSYVNMGTTQLFSVPYSFVASTSQGLQNKTVSNITPTSGQALVYDGTQWAPGTPTNYGWLLTGNSSTNPQFNFLGTTDNQPLKFRVNNIVSGEINPITNNLFFGPYTGQSNSSGGFNIGIGYKALNKNTTESGMIAIGDSALFSNVNGYTNIAIGQKALLSNLNGFNNLAMGPFA